MEDIGYLLSEAPFLALIIGLAVKLVRWRRARNNRPSFSEHDHRVLFQAPPYGPQHWRFYPRFVIAVIGVAASGLLQIVALGSLGAAVLTATMVLTSATIVRGVILAE